MKNFTKTMLFFVTCTLTQHSGTVNAATTINKDKVHVGKLIPNVNKKYLSKQPLLGEYVNKEGTTIIDTTRDPEIKIYRKDVPEDDIFKDFILEALEKKIKLFQARQFCSREYITQAELIMAADKHNVRVSSINKNNEKKTKAENTMFFLFKTNSKKVAEYVYSGIFWTDLDDFLRTIQP